MTRPYTPDALRGLRASGQVVNVGQLVATMKDPDLFRDAAAVFYRTLCASPPRRRAIDLDRFVASNGIATMLSGCYTSTPNPSTHPASEAQTLRMVKSIFALGSTASIKFNAESLAWNVAAVLGLPSPPLSPRLEAATWAGIDKAVSSLFDLTHNKVAMRHHEAAKRLVSLKQDLGATPAPTPSEVSLRNRVVRRLAEVVTRLSDERCVGRSVECLMLLTRHSCEAVAESAIAVAEFAPHVVALLCSAVTAYTADHLLQLVACLSSVSRTAQQLWAERFGIMHVAFEVKASRFPDSPAFDPRRFQRQLGCGVQWILEKIGYVLGSAAATTQPAPTASGESTSPATPAYSGRIGSLLDDLHCRCGEASRVEEVMSYQDEDTGLSGISTLRRLFATDTACRPRVAAILSELCRNAGAASRDLLARELYVSGLFADGIAFLLPSIVQSLGLSEAAGLTLVDALSRVTGFVATCHAAAAKELTEDRTLATLQSCHAVFPESQSLSQLLREVLPLLPACSVEDLLVQIETDFDESSGDPLGGTHDVSPATALLLSVTSSQGGLSPAGGRRPAGKSAGNFASAAVRMQSIPGWEASFAESCGFATVFDILGSEASRSLMTRHGVVASLELCRGALSVIPLDARRDAIGEMWRAQAVDTLAALWGAHPDSCRLVDASAALLLECFANDPTASGALREAVRAPAVALLCQASAAPCAQSLRQHLLACTTLEEAVGFLRESLQSVGQAGQGEGPTGCDRDAVLLAVYQLQGFVCGGGGGGGGGAVLSDRLRRCDAAAVVCKQLVSDAFFPTNAPAKELLIDTLLAMGPRLLAELDVALMERVLHKTALHVGSGAAVSLAAGLFSVLSVDSIPALCGGGGLLGTALYRTAVDAVLGCSHDAHSSTDWYVFLSICAEASPAVEQDLWRKGMMYAFQANVTLFEDPAAAATVSRALMRLAGTHAELSVDKRDMVFGAGLLGQAIDRGMGGTIEAALLATALRSGEGIPEQPNPDDADADADADADEVMLNFERLQRNTWYTGIASAEPNYFHPWAERIQRRSTPLHERVRWATCAVLMAQYFPYSVLQPLLEALAAVFTGMLDQVQATTMQRTYHDSQAILLFVPDADDSPYSGPLESLAVLQLSILDCAQACAVRNREEFPGCALYAAAVRVHRTPPHILDLPAAVRSGAQQVLMACRVDFNTIPVHEDTEFVRKPEPKQQQQPDADAPDLPTPGDVSIAGETPASTAIDAIPLLDPLTVSAGALSEPGTPGANTALDSARSRSSTAPPSVGGSRRGSLLGHSRLSADAALVEAAQERLAQPSATEDTVDASPAPSTPCSPGAEGVSDAAAAAPGGSGGKQWEEMDELAYLSTVKVFQYFDVMTQRLLEKRPSDAPMHIIKELKTVLSELEDELGE